MIYISSALSPFRLVFGVFLFPFVCFKPKICVLSFVILYMSSGMIQSMCSACSVKGRVVVMDLSSISDCDSALEDKLSCSSHALPSVVVVLFSLSWPLKCWYTLKKPSPTLKVGAAFACCFEKWLVAFGSAAEEGLEGMVSSVQALLTWLPDLLKNKGYRNSQGEWPRGCEHFLLDLKYDPKVFSEACLL